MKRELYLLKIGLLTVVGMLLMAGSDLLAQAEDESRFDVMFDTTGAIIDPFSDEPAKNTVAVFIEVLKHSGHVGGLNLILSKEAEDVVLPPIELQNVNVEDVWEVLTEISYAGPERALDIKEVVPNTYYFDVVGLAKEPRSISYFPAEVLLESMSMEDLVAIIERAFQVAGEEVAPQFHYHEDTQILMASLTSREKEMVNELFLTLQNSAGAVEKIRVKRLEQLEAQYAKLLEEFTQKSVELTKLTELTNRTRNKGGSLGFDGGDSAPQDNQSQPTTEERVKQLILDGEVEIMQSQLKRYLIEIASLRAQEFGFQLEFPEAKAGGH